MAIASMPSATRRCAAARTSAASSGVSTLPSRSMRSATSRRWRRGTSGSGKLQEQVVDVVALLGAHLEDVAEAARGDQAETRAAALDQGVGDQRGAVHDVADVGEREPAACSSSARPSERADRWVVRRGQALVQADVVALRVEQDEVGEGAADVETDAVAGGSGHAGSSMRRGSRIVRGGDGRLKWSNLGLQGDRSIPYRTIRATETEGGWVI